jgi:hypothetical protein
MGQVGGAIALAVQAGLQTTDLADWAKGSARGFWFMVAMVAVLCGQYVIFYKTPGGMAEEHERTRARIADANLDEGIVVEK